jgi:hypothetical protein
MTLLSWLLLKTPISDAAWAQLPPATHVVTALSPLLDDRKPLIRAKALLLLAACSRNPWFLQGAIPKGLLHHAANAPATGSLAHNDLKEAEEYSKQCQAALHATLLAASPMILKLVRSISCVGSRVQHSVRKMQPLRPCLQFQFGLERETLSSCDVQVSSESASQPANTEPLLAVVVQLLESAYRPLVATPALVGQMSDTVRGLWVSADRAEAHAELRDHLQQLVETVLQPQDLLMPLATPLVQRLLPAMCEVRITLGLATKPPLPPICTELAHLLATHAVVSIVNLKSDSLIRLHKVPAQCPFWHAGNSRAAGSRGHREPQHAAGQHCTHTCGCVDVLHCQD